MSRSSACSRRSRPACKPGAIIDTGPCSSGAAESKSARLDTKRLVDALLERAERRTFASGATTARARREPGGASRGIRRLRPSASSATAASTLARASSRRTSTRGTLASARSRTSSGRLVHKRTRAWAAALGSRRGRPLDRGPLHGERPRAGARAEPFWFSCGTGTRAWIRPSALLEKSPPNAVLGALPASLGRLAGPRKGAGR